MPSKTYTVSVSDTNMCRLIRLYVDSIVDKNINIYYQDSVQGMILGKSIVYRLKVPLEIKTTHTITDSIPFPVNQSGWYAMAGLGISKTNNHAYIGVNYIGRKQFSYGIAYDVFGKSLNGFVGIKISR